MYDRERIIASLVSSPPDDVGFVVEEGVALRVADDLVLLTYRLDFGGRVSRRSSLWRSEQGALSLVFHQGTAIES